MSLRREFIEMALKSDANISQLCGRFSISRKTGYKWLKRAAVDSCWQDRSHRPHSSPSRTLPDLEARVVDLRREHPCWGGRKLHRVLSDRGVLNVPAASTITDILHRHGLIAPEETVQHRAFQRFERAHPNELWQMDFKGAVETDQDRVHPLTILDDHSRYAVGLFACSNERTETVRERLISTFRRYGLPQSILCDNGAPWGTTGSDERHTGLTVWLMQHGVRVLHGRPYHPQTQGKDERFHRTLKAEVLAQRFPAVSSCQPRFDRWRHDYNWVRPHHALKMDVPGKHYQASSRNFSEHLPIADYSGAGLEVRTVDCDGRLSLKGQSWKIGKAFIGQKVAIEPTLADGVMNVIFYGHVIAKLDRRSVQ